MRVRISPSVVLLGAVDEGEDLAVCGVAAALEVLDETVGYVLLGHLMGAGLLDLGLHYVLDLLDAERAVECGGELLDLGGDAVDARFGELVGIVNCCVCLADGGCDLGRVEHGL